MTTPQEPFIYVQPAPGRPRRPWGLIAAISAVSVVVLAGLVFIAITARGPRGHSHAAASPTWHSAFGDTTAAATGPANAGDPAARDVCAAVQKAGTDGEYDPAQMLMVAAVGVNVVDPDIAPHVELLKRSALIAQKDPSDMKSVLSMATAAIDLSTACVNAHYISP